MAAGGVNPLGLILITMSGIESPTGVCIKVNRGAETQYHLQMGRPGNLETFLCVRRVTDGVLITMGHDDTFVLTCAGIQWLIKVLEVAIMDDPKVHNVGAESIVFRSSDADMGALPRSDHTSEIGCAEGGQPRYGNPLIHSAVGIYIRKRPLLQ